MVYPSGGFLSSKGACLINEFRDMKMQPSLERALKHKEILGA